MECTEDWRDREAAGLMLTLVLAALLKLKAVVLLPLEEGPNLLSRDVKARRERQREWGRGGQQEGMKQSRASPIIVS